MILNILWCNFAVLSTRAVRQFVKRYLWKYQRDKINDIWKNKLFRLSKKKKTSILLRYTGSFNTKVFGMAPTCSLSEIASFIAINFFDSKIVYFDTRGQNGRLAHCIFILAVSELPVWPHVSNHIFLYKFMRARVGSPFTDIKNAPQLNFTRQLSTRRYEDSDR